MLDTSTVILLGRLANPAGLPDESVVSVITLAELSVGPHVARTARERVARQAHLQQAEADFETIPFDAAAARAFGRVAASLRAGGHSWHIDASSIDATKKWLTGSLHGKLTHLIVTHAASIPHAKPAQTNRSKQT